MVSRCFVFFLLSADASQYTPKKNHSASIHWRGEVKGISHTRMPQLRRSSKMAGLGKHEMREGGRAFKPGAHDDKDGARGGLLASSLASIFIPQALREYSFEVGADPALGPPNKQELVPKMAGSSPGDFHPFRSANCIPNRPRQVIWPCPLGW